jgi:two-component system cell cycle response regulator
VTLLFLDLDHFKLVNDTFDHLTGSEVLSEFGRLLLSNLRATDLACRYGGEEFIILLHDTTAMQAIYVAEKLRKLVESHPFQSKDGRPIQVTVSIGIAERAASLKTPEDLITRSDEAMYKAKQNGRNRTVLYTGDDKNPFVLVTPAGLDEDTPHGLS